MRVAVLKETLCVQPVFAHQVCKLLDHLLHASALFCVCVLLGVFGLGVCHAHFDIQVLFKTLFGEHLVDLVTKVSPTDMLALFVGFEGVAEHFEFLVRNGHLRHVKADAELRRSDHSRTQTVEVAEELADARPPLTTHLSKTGQDVVGVGGAVALNLGVVCAGLALGKEVGGLVEVGAHAEKLLQTVDVRAEVHVVHFVQVALVQVASEQLLGNVGGSADAE